MAKATDNSTPESLTSTLPFLGKLPDQDKHPGRAGDRSFWSVSPTGDYAKDCRTGQDYALLFLAIEEIENGSGTLLPCVVADMPRDGKKWTGIEVGFCELIGFAAAAGANRAREIAAYWKRCEADRLRRARKAPAKRAKNTKKP